MRVLENIDYYYLTDFRGVRGCSMWTEMHWMAQS